MYSAIVATVRVVTRTHCITVSYRGLTVVLVTFLNQNEYGNIGTFFSVIMSHSWSYIVAPGGFTCRQSFIKSFPRELF